LKWVSLCCFVCGLFIRFFLAHSAISAVKLVSVPAVTTPRTDGKTRGLSGPSVSTLLRRSKAKAAINKKQKGRPGIRPADARRVLALTALGTQSPTSNNAGNAPRDAVP